jgi:hypothetical protein
VYVSAAKEGSAPAGPVTDVYMGYPGGEIFFFRDTRVPTMLLFQPIVDSNISDCESQFFLTSSVPLLILPVIVIS